MDLFKQLEPESCFIYLLDDDTELRYEVFVRATSANGAIVGSHGCTSSD
jgi:hypothetical protein